MDFPRVCSCLLRIQTGYSVSEVKIVETMMMDVDEQKMEWAR